MNELKCNITTLCDVKGRMKERNNEYHQVVKAVVSKDFKFVHVDAGINDNGFQRIFTETNEEEVFHCYLYPIIEEMVRSEFHDLKGKALTIKVTWV